MFITDAYRREQAALHAVGDYGTAALRFGKIVTALAKAAGVRSLLDYGCGSRRSLLASMNLPPDVVYEGYDPAVPDYAADPCPAELVCCIDVLEHIEPDLLDNVLDHLGTLCDPLGFFTIHSGPAKKVLSDGRNAHLTQQGREWWIPRLERRFEMLEVIQIPMGFAVLVRRIDSQLLGTEEVARELVRGLVQTAFHDGKTNVSGGAAHDPKKQHRTVVKYKGERLIYETPNEMTAWRARTLFEKEPHTIRWLETMERESVLVDIGANVGMYTVFAAVKCKARVYAFEPESQNFALLNANIEANGLSGQVAAFPLALSDTAKVDRLYLSQFEAGGSCHSFSQQVGFDLKPRPSPFAQGSVSMTLDQLVQSGAIPEPDYIKIDVDGIEHQVLAGAMKTLASPKVKSVIVELNTNLEEHRLAIDRLRELGFTYDVAQAEGAIRQEGAFRGVGEFVFVRGSIDPRHRIFTIAPPESAHERAVLRDVLAAVDRAAVETSPFPHMVIDGIFPKDYYAQMLEQFPTADSLRPIVETGRVGAAYSKDRLVVLFEDDHFARLSPAQHAFWTSFSRWMYSGQFLAHFVQKFSHALEPRIQALMSAERSFKVRSDALLVNDRTNYAIGPHSDAPHRLVTFLFYLPRDDAMRELGTSLYVPKDPSFTCRSGEHHPFKLFEKVRTVDFLPNRLLAFPRLDNSFHGVERIDRANINRPLLINNVRLMSAVA